MSRDDVCYAYIDEMGNVLTVTDRKGQVICYTYDRLNRPILTEFVNDSTGESRGYDIYGNLETLGNQAVTYTYTYDNMNRMTSKIDSRQGRSLVWQYDPVGNVSHKIDYQGEVTEFLYDSTNRLVSMRNQGYLQVSYHYDPAGRLLNRILSNGARTDYRFDNDNRLLEMSNVSVNQGLAQTQHYSHDEVGNITAITEGNDSTSFVYDSLYRLISADYPGGNVQDRVYTYDRVGNRKTMRDHDNGGLGYVYDDGNRLTAVNFDSDPNETIYRFEYDANGNRIAKRQGLFHMLQSYVYDQKNRVTSLTTATETLTFQYDANDFRIGKVSNKGARSYLMEGEHFEAVYGANDTLQAKYLRGVVVDEIVNGYLYDKEGIPTNYTFHHDHLQSVTALSGHNGDVKETAAFGPFGETISRSGRRDNNLQYTGREADPETGRFLNEDPKGFGAGVNFYAYVLNNPINANDPSGLDTQISAGVDGDLIVVGGGVGGGPSLGVSLPDDPYNNWRDIQFFVKTEAQMVTGAGVLADIGLSSSVSHTSGRLPEGLSTDTSIVVMGAYGFGSVGSLSLELNAYNSDLSVSDLPVPFSTHVGLGAGAFAGGGFKTATTYASPTIGDMLDSVISFFGGNTSGAGGGFVIYPSKPNRNVMTIVYSK